ncbi:MAG: hypothetical protein HOW71_04135 [Nonomuraea sp.]|nr:hypothetical protein [Nonomuraea sp.]
MELLTGEPLALDLINTRGHDFDALDTPEGFREWLNHQTDRLDGVRPTPGDPLAPPLAPDDPVALRLAPGEVGAVRLVPGDSEGVGLASGGRGAVRLASDGPVLAVGDLEAVRALRGAVEAAVDAVRRADPPPPEAVEAINAAMRAAPSYGYVDVAGSVVTKGARRHGDALARLLAQLAEAAADLLADPAASRIRTCEGPRCRMIFLPAHPRRRWCSPELCGNRVRVARHYQRRKSL